MLDGSGFALAWVSPLDLAAHLPDGTAFALLYSGESSEHARYSYLACGPTALATTLAELKILQARYPSELLIGYFGYECGLSLAATADYGAFPSLCFSRYATIFRWDHQDRLLERFGEETVFTDATAADIPPVVSVTSNMSKADYCASVERTIAAIHAGEFYQANITRKFYGEFSQGPSPLAIFARLSSVSPARYSALLDFGDGRAIVSSSPEGFVRIDSNRKVVSQPIKGTIRREADPVADARQRDILLASAKDQAENLMIVDLTRNDLARCCEPGSVMVEQLNTLATYSTLHHLVSTVSGTRLSSASALDCVAACFPPGSMTGAPKRRVVDWCAAQEQLPRGIYSGALGWLRSDSADFSVIIRTLVLDERRFEFQVGGGVVADSTPDQEWREILLKATGISTALGISREILADL